MVRFLVGVDGGGTGTRVVLADRHGGPLGRGTSGPSGLAHGAAPAWQAILAGLAEAGRQADVEPRPAECALAAGLAGVNHPGWLAGFVAANPGFARLVTATDAHIAMLAAHHGRPGVLVAAGTGSVATALFSDGTQRSAGGWGFPIGDEGSGAWLGTAAMRHAQCAMDGRADGGTLAAALGRICGSGREQLLAWSLGAGQTAYAGLAPLVFDCAGSDPAAAALLDQAAAALEALAEALDPSGQLPVAVVGSVASRLVGRWSAALRARVSGDGVEPALGALELLLGPRAGTMTEPASAPGGHARRARRPTAGNGPES